MSKGTVMFVTLAIGWPFCLGLLVGAWFLGWWIASHFDAWSNADRDMFGLLSALALIWIYERYDADKRYKRLLELVARLCELVP